MKRVSQFLAIAFKQRDCFGGFVFLAVILVGVAACSITVSPTMKQAALKRFHLASDSFLGWAAHQTVPAMYNFENRIWFSNTINPQGSFNPADESYVEAPINHFPARFITFGDWRHVLRDGQEGMFKMESAYGDTVLVSRWELRRDRPDQPDQIVVHRVQQQFVKRADSGARDD